MQVDFHNQFLWQLILYNYGEEFLGRYHAVWIYLQPFLNVYLILHAYYISKKCYYLLSLHFFGVIYILVSISF
ncbi:hypothetical protein C1645_776327 [Glomus cerebriforme]|uniref:Uncharacterized protein n=1 Tax=Glomus cerebriforme TaxID=658196 RepID=A0A397SNT3_9GLOM|nr:hypothetical protein C1645_776327 [Glomus cerebriforme]